MDQVQVSSASPTMSVSQDQEKAFAIREVTASTRKHFEEEAFDWYIFPEMVPRQTENFTLSTNAFYTGEKLGVQYTYACKLSVVNGIISVGFKFGLSSECPDLKGTRASVKYSLTDSFGQLIAEYDQKSSVRVAMKSQSIWNTQIPLSRVYGLLAQNGDTNGGNVLFRISAIIRTATLMTKAGNVKEQSKSVLVKTKLHKSDKLESSAPPSMDGPSPDRVRVTLLPDQVCTDDAGENKANSFTLEHVERKSESVVGSNNVPTVSDTWVKVDQPSTQE